MHKMSLAVTLECGLFSVELAALRFMLLPEKLVFSMLSECLGQLLLPVGELCLSGEMSLTDTLMMHAISLELAALFGVPRMDCAECVVEVYRWGMEAYRWAQSQSAIRELDQVHCFVTSSRCGIVVLPAEGFFVQSASGFLLLPAEGFFVQSAIGFLLLPAEGFFVQSASDFFLLPASGFFVQSASGLFLLSARSGFLVRSPNQVLVRVAHDSDLVAVTISSVWRIR